MCAHVYIFNSNFTIVTSRQSLPSRYIKKKKKTFLCIEIIVLQNRRVCDLYPPILYSTYYYVYTTSTIYRRIGNRFYEGPNPILYNTSTPFCLKLYERVQTLFGRWRRYVVVRVCILQWGRDDVVKDQVIEIYMLYNGDLVEK